MHFTPKGQTTFLILMPAEALEWSGAVSTRLIDVIETMSLGDGAGLKSERSGRACPMLSRA